jgi:uncharacterized membrane protein (DUF4010 family)
MTLDSTEARLALSLALGLLLGVERERRKNERPHGAFAGLRTFGLVGFLGGLMSYLAVPYAVVAGSLFVGGLAVVGYARNAGRDQDPGVTTEVALLLTYVLGAVALSEPMTAAVGAIVTAALLYFRTHLHSFVGRALREDEIHDGLLLLVFAFVILPLAPDVNVGPYAAINPQAIARLMFVVTFISAVGYATQRIVGPRWGLVLSGLGSGFVSSSATIAALGLRSRQDASAVRSAATGAVASSIATVLQYGAILATIDRTLLERLSLPLGCALASAIGITIILARQATEGAGASETVTGRAFQILPALAVGAGSALIAIVAAALASSIGDAGIVVISAAAGLIDAHATTGSIAALHAGGRISPEIGALALVTALTSNTVTKIVMAASTGPRAYAIRVSASVALIAASAWAGLLPTL